MNSPEKKVFDHVNPVDWTPAESRSRSWAKSLSWRVVGVVMLGGISYAITRDVQQTTIITLIFHVLRTVLYYYHERLWGRITWGKPRHPLACLPVKRNLTSEDYAAIAKLLEQRNCLAAPEYVI